MSRHPALVLAALFSCAVSGPASAAPPAGVAEDVTLTVVPAETSVYAGDPLLVKSVFLNRGKEAVRISRAFDAGWGGIRFEVCPPRQTTFERACAVGEGRMCGKSAGVEVAVGTSVVGYEQLISRGWPARVSVFSTPGRWQLRASVVVGKEVVTSGPVTVTVVDPPEGVKTALRDCATPIHSCLSSVYGIGEGEVKEAAEAQERLGGSNAGRAITQALVLRELRYAGAAKARQFAWAAVAKHRNDLGPVAREHFDLLTVDVLVQRSEYADAKKLLDALPERSVKRDWLQPVVDHHLHERGK